MPHELLLLGISCDPRRDTVIAEKIKKMVEEMIGTSSFLGNIFLWFSLINVKDILPSTFDQVLQRLLEKIKDPLLFEPIMQYSGVIG